MNNIKYNVKNFILNYKIIITIILFLIVSFFVYKYVLADNDPLEDKILVNDATVSEMIDGTQNKNGLFDEVEEPGNDTADKNQIVRNFDSVSYDISYRLDYDSSVADEDKEPGTTRSVVVDILVPTFIERVDIGSGSSDASTYEPTLENDTRKVIDNKYYLFTSKPITGVPMETDSQSINIKLFVKYGENNDEIKPIIRLRESTRNVSDMTTTSGNVNDIVQVTVSAKKKYSVKLLNDSHSDYLKIVKNDEDTSTKLPLGIVLYLPEDEEKGIKGIEVPKTASITLEVTPNEDNQYVQNAPIKSNCEIKNSSDEGYTDYNPKNNDDDLSLDYHKETNEKFTFNLSYSDLKLGSDDFQIESGKNVKYLSSKILIMENSKDDLDSILDDIVYNISVSLSASEVLDSITITDNYQEYIGIYKSTISFTNSSNNSNQEVLTNHGKSIFNLGERFNIINNIKYVTGDDIQLLTNYIKIDNRAIQISEFDSSNPYKVDESGIKTDMEDDEEEEDSELEEETSKPDLLFGVGSWSSEYFELNMDESNPDSIYPDYCPDSIEDLEIEDYINLYGGPCLRLKEENEQINSDDASNANGPFWYSYENAQAALADNKDIIVVKYNYENPDGYSIKSGSEITISLSAVVREDSLDSSDEKYKDNIGKSFMVTSRGTTLNNSSTTGDDTYYLSEVSRKSVSDLSSDLTYYKTEYTKENDEYNISIEESTQIDDVDFELSNIGDTLLVSAYKAYISDIKISDVDDSQRTTFYSGINDPIKFEIIPVITSNERYSIDSALINVKLPKSLELYKKTGDKLPISEEEKEDYIEYIYSYTSDDIGNDGTLSSLIIHAFIDIATQNNKDISVTASIKSTAKKGEEIFKDVMPLSKRERSVNLTLKNTKPINSIGKVDNIRIDENGTYIYNVRAVNNIETIDSNSSLSLLYILPSSGDSVGKGSNFNGELLVSIDNLQSGYSAKYTTDDYKTILTKELNNPNSINWTNWTNTSEKISNITAIKIETTNSIAKNEYFSSKDGIDINIETKDNKESDKYYNSFYMLYTKGGKTNAYVSNVSEVSVYDRIISGYAFEDIDYNGFYDSKIDERLKDIIVDLYRLKTDEITTDDEHINDKDTLTDEKGFYKFEGLKQGKYYVKYTFDCDKYTVTDKNKKDAQIGNTSSIDSDAKIINNVKINGKSVCYAITDIITLDNENVEYSNIDIGLKIRQEFDIKIDKYITNAKIYKEDSLIYNKDYSNAKMIKLDVKDLDDTLFRITYVIEIENTKYFPGTIGVLMENIPEEMIFNPDLPENEGWEEEDEYLTYPDLEKTILMPGEKIYLKVVLDLEPYSAGDFINYVAADSLNISNVNNSFLEVQPKNEVIINDDGGYPEEDE